jgi:hypothetical protein
MTTIGILNIIFGALFSLVFLLMILGAGFMTAAGAAMGGEEGAQAAASGGFLMLVGIASFAINLMLFVSGIGVLKVSPWGRNLSIAYGGLGVIVYGAWMIGGGFSIPTLASLAYCVILMGLFFTPSWKATYCSTDMTPESVPAPSSASPASPESPETSEPEESRDAA